MKKYIIWLDDMRPIPEEIDHSKYVWYITAEGMIKDFSQITKHFNEIDYISLDNDLGADNMEGYKVLDWLESLQIDIPFGIHIHTANPVARERMRAIIQRNGWKEIY